MGLVSFIASGPSASSSRPFSGLSTSDALQTSGLILHHKGQVGLVSFIASGPSASSSRPFSGLSTSDALQTSGLILHPKGMKSSSPNGPSIWVTREIRRTPPPAIVPQENPLCATRIQLLLILLILIEFRSKHSHV